MALSFKTPTRKKRGPARTSGEPLGLTGKGGQVVFTSNNLNRKGKKGRRRVRQRRGSGIDVQWDPSKGGRPGGEVHYPLGRK